MTDYRFRVGVGVEPYVLRSALGACLEQDPRLVVEVLPPNCDNDTVGSVMVPAPRCAPDAILTAVEDCPPQVQLSVAGTRRTMPYHGMEGFAEALINVIAAVMPGQSGGFVALDGGAR